jgi:hypothetical protein
MLVRLGFEYVLKTAPGWVDRKSLIHRLLVDRRYAQAEKELTAYLND